MYNTNGSSLLQVETPSKHRFPQSESDAEELEQKFQNKFPKKEPLPLQRTLIQSAPFPFDALGPILGKAAKKIEEIVKAPGAICGQAVLAAASLTVQGFCNVSIHGRSIPLSLYAISVGESGIRKSAVDTIVLRPIREYEKMLSVSFKEELRIYKNQMDVLKKKRTDTMNQFKAEFLELELNKLSEEPQRPLDPNILIEEPTLEGLHKLFSTGQPSLGIFSDEGGRMLSGHGMSRENLLKTAAGLSSLWDGKPITRIRGGDENLLLYGRRLSLHLMIQEVVLSQILKNELLDGQGLIARCLIVYPQSNAGHRPYNAIDISIDPDIKNYWSLINTLLIKEFPLSDPQVKNELNPRSLTLSETAMQEWIGFHDLIDRELGSDGAYRSIHRMANKAAEQALRISGVLQLIDDFESAEITLSTMERAIKLVQFYISESLRISESISIDPDLELAEATLLWMRKKAKTDGPARVFSVRDLCKNGGPQKVRNKKSAEKVLAILEDHEAIEKTDPAKKEWRLV